MKIILTGSLGNVSQPLATMLVAQGHTVTVISRQPDKQAAIEALGAMAAIGSLDDAAFLATTFTGADALFAMVPPPPPAEDRVAQYRRVATNYVQAVRQAGVPRVVHLSSWGAEQAQGVGPIKGSYVGEQVLNEGLVGVALTHLRPCSFYPNLLSYIPLIKQAGFVGTNYGPDTRQVFVAPTDVAAAAAEELTRASGPAARYVASDERSAADIARVLGAAIDRPDLSWRELTNEQVQANLERAKLPAPVIHDIIELGVALRTGLLRQGYDQHPPAQLGQVKLEDYAREFAAAYMK